MHRALDLLPIELWQEIMERATELRDFNAWARTCSALAALARDKALKARE